MADEPVTLLGTGPVAERLGVEPNTLVAWVNRHPPGSPTPLPQPVRINTGRRFVYGWYESQVDDLRRWREGRDQGLPRSREELERIAREAEQDTSAELEAAVVRGEVEVVYPPGWKGGKNDG